MAKTRTNKTKTKSNKKVHPARPAQPSYVVPLFVIACLVLGSLGLTLAAKRPRVTPPAGSPALPVIQGNREDINQGQNQTFEHLQQAARVQDLLQGKKGDTLQSGTSVETLLKNIELK